MLREIVVIDEELCDGCGKCIPNCHEGALQIIDGKARLVSELMCDGLGACVGYCPQGAIRVEERHAEPYDEIQVLQKMLPKGKNTIIAHLKHLKDHNETALLHTATDYLQSVATDVDFSVEDILHTIQSHAKPAAVSASSCLGSKPLSFSASTISIDSVAVQNSESQLRHWPIQLHLINPQAAYYNNAHVVIAADCAAYSHADFHANFIKGKSIAIACPKLDHGSDIYIKKITAMIDLALVKSITVVQMEVPCCNGLFAMVQQAQRAAQRKVPIKKIVLSIKGTILE